MELLLSNYHDPLVLLLAKVLATAFVTTYAIAHIRQKSTKTTTSKSTTGSSTVPPVELLRLTDPESKFYKHDIPYICTITWMKGDYESAKIHLQRRLQLMIQKNPWLLGRIESKQGSCYLTYSKQQPEKNAGDEETMMHVICPSSSPISRQTPICNLNDILCNSGLLIQNGPHQPIFNVSIIPCSENPKESFALLVQFSHAIGDGATYYKLFNMLCSMEDDNIIEMIPERISSNEKLQIDALGKIESYLFSSGGNAIRAIRGMLACWISGNTTQVHYGWVDASKIRDIKEMVAKESSISFVSTNDIITSWFMNQVGCPMGAMAINWRGRLIGHTDAHAGNYENMIFYNMEDFATPALIRQSLTKYRRIVTGDRPMPPWYMIATTSMSVVTNWATFGKPIQVMGCVEDIHLPVSSGKYYPTTMPSLIIFRASKGRIGLAYVHGDGGVNHLDHAPFVNVLM